MLIPQENTFIYNLATETQQIAAINETIRRPIYVKLLSRYTSSTNTQHLRVPVWRLDIILLLLSPLPVTKARDEMAASSRLPTILCSKEAL